MLITAVLESSRYRPIFDLAVAGYIENLPPSIADVTRRLERTASSVHDQARRLQAEGYIELVGDAKRARRLVLTQKGLEAADLKPRAPRSASTFEPPSGFEFETVTQPARCGPATLAGANVTQLSITHLFPSWRDGDRAIIADDCSMIDPAGNKASIYPGDIAHGRDGIDPTNGQNVYVEYGVETGQGMEHECNIKQFFFDEQTCMVTLRSLNPDYPSIIRPIRDIGSVAVILSVRRIVTQSTK